MEKSNNTSFFDFDEKDKHIIVSETELFDIIDKSNNINNLVFEGKKNRINNVPIFNEDQEKLIESEEKYNTIIKEEVTSFDNKINNFSNEYDIIEDDEEEVIELSLSELYDYYEKKKKAHYFIKEKTENLDYLTTDNEKSKRNLMLDKLTEAKTKDILDENDFDIISDEMDILDNEEDDDRKEEKLYKEDEIIELGEKNKNINKNEPENEEILKNEVKEILNYIDNLLDALPEEKIKQFANSKYFSLYKKILKEL